MTNRERQRRERQRQTTAPLYVSPDQFAHRIGVSRATVWRMMARGGLRFAKFGRVRRIPISECERLTTGA